MQRQIPRGPENLYCPLHKASMDTVCHKCPWWQQVRGVNPNTGEEIDRWDCAVAFLPLLLIEAAQQARQGAAATESFRNHMLALATARHVSSESHEIVPDAQHVVAAVERRAALAVDGKQSVPHRGEIGNAIPAHSG
jgi:hypothetical protein